MKLLLLCPLLSLLSACGHSNKIQVPEVKHNVVKVKKTDSILIKQKEYRDAEIKDSLQLKLMLKDVLAIAKKYHRDKIYYQKSIDWPYELSSATGSIRFGHLFSSFQKHLIVTRTLGMLTHVDVLLLKGPDFYSVASWFIDDMCYLDYTIKDVDGDHKKDFLVHWYPSSGCCRRNVYDVYLSRKERFTSKYEFVNPTFFPVTKIIRGVDYGHPGEVALYKYKWNGLRVDTVEYIYPADTLKQKYYLIHNRNERDEPGKMKLLTGVPKEYKKIESFDWFMDY